MNNQVNIVLGVIGSDCHAVGNRILDATLRQAGFNVVNLGVMVGQEEFISAAIETDAKAILVSSLYGHAELDCEGFRDKCLEKGLDRIVLYVGGNLSVGKAPCEEIIHKFKGMGFDRVFTAESPLDEAVGFLKKDLKIA